MNVLALRGLRRDRPSRRPAAAIGEVEAAIELEAPLPVDADHDPPSELELARRDVDLERSGSAASRRHQSPLAVGAPVLRALRVRDTEAGLVLTAPTCERCEPDGHHHDTRTHTSPMLDDHIAS
jgi:hypothetical protein